MSATTEAQSRTSSPDSFAALFEASIAQADSLKDGDIVTGTVIKLNKDSVVVDIGYKSEGLIPMS
ncbi:MAG: S1 RNA-binding domain-containing protein, partial [Polyangiales bacterium]